MASVKQQLTAREIAAMIAGVPSKSGIMSEFANGGWCQENKSVGFWRNAMLVHQSPEVGAQWTGAESTRIVHNWWRP